MTSIRRTPNSIEALAAISTLTGLNEYLTSTGGALNVNGSFSITGGATSANQTNGSQKTQLVDGSGNVIGATTNALDINIKSGNPTSITANAGTNLNTSLLALETGGNLATLAGAITASVAQANVKQINGVAPSMGNGISGTGVQRVTLASDGTGQVKLAASSGTDIGALTANQSVNLNQLAGNTISSGVGASGTGTLRVVGANNEGRTIVSAGGSASSSGNNTLVAAGTNKLKVFAFTLSTTSTTAVTCIFQSGAGGTELWRVVLQAPTSVSTGANLVVPLPSYLFATASATLLNLNLSGAQTVHWAVSYIDEA